MAAHFKNDESGRRAFDKARQEKISEINLRCQELGIGISDALLNTARFDSLQDFLVGTMELEPDEETGQPRVVRSSADRLDFEMQVLEYVMKQVETQGVAAAFDPNTPRPERASGIVLPGQAGF